MLAKIINGDFANQQVSVEEIQDVHSRVRLQEWPRKWCVLYISNQNLDFSQEYPEDIKIEASNSHDSHHDDITPPEHIEHAEKPVETESWKQIWEEYKAMIVVMLFIMILSVLLFSIYEQEPAKQDPTKIDILTQELNKLNTLDSQDVSIRNSAQDRINNRKQKKLQILTELSYYENTN